MRTTRRRTTLLTTTASATAALLAAGVLTAVTAHAAAGCQVNYSVAGEWPGGFTGNVVVTNLGDAVSGWTLRWSYSAGQQVVSPWNATISQSGSQVTASNLSYNSDIPTNGNVSFGFNGSWNNSNNPAPTSFTLNGVACTGGVTPTTPGGTTPPPTTAPPTTPPPTTPPPTNPPGPPSGLVGWATQNGGTTGGGNASSTTVTSESALRSAVSSSSAAVIRVSGTISCSGMLSVGSNKSILGSGSSATISGCGFNINGSRNVIIRNINFRNWNDDAINVQESATNVWVDHNSFTNGYDGAVDIKRGSDYITVSWNRVFNHGKSMLLGHSDNNSSQDRGHLRVTYHHNWFDGSGSRHPRVRFGNPVHVFNNYYYNNDYGVASTMGAGVLVEGNYFDSVDDPTLVGYAASGPGTLVQRNNHFVNSGSPEASGSVASIPYSYSLTNASQVKSVVTGGAGTGKIGL
ncbi:cellulose binding domain-containing protein [Micromonospora sp. LOL_024]|uniref:pectate lyase family protein n=1 Tax=Micromonospora sp. LOL_024 TaxID=3345412 RepID=UPI003A868DB5